MSNETEEKTEVTNAALMAQMKVVETKVSNLNFLYVLLALVFIGIVCIGIQI
jgi:hypothetical protein